MNITYSSGGEYVWPSHMCNHVCRAHVLPAVLACFAAFGNTPCACSSLSMVANLPSASLHATKQFSGSVWGHLRVFLKCAVKVAPVDTYIILTFLGTGTRGGLGDVRNMTGTYLEDLESMASRLHHLLAHVMQGKAFMVVRRVVAMRAG